MLLALIVCHLALVASNPFHKFPTVFLLDVGNEELEKTNSEQIRVSIPGGSVALRYPAIGDGDTIGHLRVSSIDFGTAFKASIVDGGPGYKYVVIVLMGNPGVPYDAVLTVQTVSDGMFSAPNIGNSFAVPVQEAENNSAEDTSDGPQVNSYQSQYQAQSSNAELMQSSVNVYNYAEKEEMDESGSSDFGNDGLSEESEIQGDNEDSESDIQEINNDGDQGDIHKEYTDDVDQIDESNVKVNGIETDDADDDEEVSPELAQSSPDDFNDDDNEVDSNINSNDYSFRPYLSAGEVYYEDADSKNTRPDYQQDTLDYDSLDEIQQLFNDGEAHNNVEKYRDTNNNNYNIDSDDSYAVAY